MRVLTVNPGSTSLKVHVVEGGEASDLGHSLDETVLRSAGALGAAAVRVVHGGMGLRRHALADDAVIAAVETATELAPLHTRQSLTAMRTVRSASPATPVVVCMDTDFHSRMPDASRIYPLPAEWRQRWGLERLGFHGLSHQWAARRGAELMGTTSARARLVTCHLGGGASLAAVSLGTSVDTTMGFTPLEGLMMATRSGSIDPGMLLWLLATQRLTLEELSAGLEHQSGLSGVAGSDDMRVLTHEMDGDADARLALAMYSHRLCAGIAAMAASMGGLDGIVFTGGVGENSAILRTMTGERLGFLGVSLDDEANAAAQCDSLISASRSRVACCLVKAREELVMAEIAESMVGDS